MLELGLFCYKSLYLGEKAKIEISNATTSYFTSYTYIERQGGGA
jgi:hypothetical protein